MADVPVQPNFKDCLTIGEAADFLGVSPWTLRNWDRAGKLRTVRHPKNGYRIYRREDLESLLRPQVLAGRVSNRLAPGFDWAEVKEDDHVVQFYESDSYLTGSLTRYLGPALEAGGAVILICTRAHRGAVLRKLRARGLDLAAARSEGRFVALDAAGTLARFMVDGTPDAARFRNVIGEVITRAAQGGRRVRAFGEMVALLWAEGKRQAAIRLEELWNELRNSHRFALLCAYPAGVLAVDGEESLDRICTCHTRVVPAESYAALAGEAERTHEVARLQRRARALEAEIAHRTEVEARLAALGEEQQAELEELKQDGEARALLAAIVESSQDAIVSKTLEGQILTWNAGAEKMFGFTAAEVVGRSITMIIPPERLHEEDMILASIRAGRRIETYETVRVAKDGCRIDVSLTISPVRDASGRVVAASKVARDISARKRAEAALREADRRKDEFLATLAHELRNPLAPIRNALQIMRLAGDNRLAVEQARAMMDRQVQQMVRLVDDLLDVSRITSGKVELKKERVALSSIIASAVETSRPLIEAARHRLTVSLPPELVVFEADPTRLAQVVSNLLNNAAKYTDPGGRIDLSAMRRGEEVVIRVRDTGIGIPPDMLPHVFDMFTQLDRSTGRAQGGLGVGLGLVRTLVGMHGGRVEARSDGPGCGSEFIVTLPAAPARAAAMPEADGHANGKAAPPSRRVLVVEDNVDAAQSLAMLLRVLGQDVRTAADGRQALEVAREFQPDVAFLDIGIPGMTGYELARRLRAEPWAGRALLVALTGWGQEEDRQRSREAGFDVHVTKPADPALLQELLKRRDRDTEVQPA